MLWYVDEVPEKYQPFLDINPLYPLLDALSQSWTSGGCPTPDLLLLTLAWAVGGARRRRAVLHLEGA